MPTSNSNYALELVVGIQDAFTQQAKKIEKESGKLERDFKDLQKTVADVDAYKKAEKALSELTKEEKKNNKAINAQQSELERLGHSLKQSGFDIRNIVDEEKKLQQQVQKTNADLKKQGGALKHIENIGALAGAATATAGLAWAGNDKARNERLLAARSSYSLEDVQSVTQRQFRSDLIRKYGADQESIFAAQAMAKQQNLSDQDTMDLTKATIQLQKIFPDYSSPETVRALANISKGFGISIKEAADKLYATSSTIGDTNGDLLDTFAEYSPLLGDKISFDQFSASIIQARKAGVWNTDKVGDSLKESFMARFSDSGEFAKLVGAGDKAGTIDSIQNADLRERIKTAAYRVREDVKSGAAPGNNYAALLALVNSASNTSDAGAIKPLLESIGGTILSEDVGTKGVSGIVDGLTNPEASLANAQSLDEAADSISTVLDKSMNAWSTGIDSLTNRSSDLIDSMDGLGDVISKVAGGVSGSMNGNSAIGYAGLATAIGGAFFGGRFATKIGTKIGGKLLNKVLGTATSAPAPGIKSPGMFSRFFSKSADPIANVAKEASFLPKAGGTLLRGGKSLLKRVPLIGTALNAGSIAMSAAEGDEEQVWKDVGSTVGSWLGGVGGGLLTGGIGAVGGTVGGSMLGETAASWLYDIFNGDKDQVNAKAVAQTEQSIQTAPTQQALVSPPPITIDLSFTPSIQIDATSSDPEALSQTLVASLRDMTPQLKQALHDAMDDLWKDMDALDQN